MRKTTSLPALLLLIGASFAGCAGKEDTPTVVAEAFYAEMAAGNVEAAKRLSTPATAEMLGYIVASHTTDMFEPIAEAGASGELIDGDSAFVSFVEGGGFATVPLVKVDGNWKVDFATMIEAHRRLDPVPLTL